ncbi:hypothetical protein [Streptomyces goshikiensis]
MDDYQVVGVERELQCLMDAEVAVLLDQVVGERGEVYAGAG